MKGAFAHEFLSFNVIMTGEGKRKNVFQLCYINVNDACNKH